MKLGNISLSILLGLIFSATPAAFAKIYQCDNGDCVTTINDGDGFDGFTWSISCNDGSWAYGEVQGANYGGNCMPLTE
jgi:hypothetical protein